LPFVDARHVAAGTLLNADICIAGAGPAGLALALALSRGGKRVVLLESGGFDAVPDIDELDGFESAGAPLRTERLRDRRFGGTRWYGRAVRMDPIDFEDRPWVADGWPLRLADIEPYYARAARFLGFERPQALHGGWWDGNAVTRALSGGGITPSIHLIAREKDLARRHRRAVASASSLTAVINATLLGIDVDEGRATVAGLRVVASTGGPEFGARADSCVLACGGLENARLLLLLSADRPGVLGPSGPALGRCYINHARAEGVGRLYLDPARASYASVYRHLAEHPSRAARCSMQLAAGLDERMQREERLLNAAAFFYPASERRLAVLREPLERLRRSIAGLRLEKGDAHRLRQLAPELPLLAGAALARLRHRPYRLDHLVMVDQLEQAPDARSRLGLSAARDRFGRRQLRIEWRIGEETVRTHRRFHELLAARLREQGVGTLRSALLEDPDLVPEYEDNAHPMGGTRMSRDPRSGVVDADGRVHALRNLYVAGSSVFPTGGQANPTLTIVALALRLADHLASGPR